MLRVECVRDAAEGITTAALLGQGWEEALHRFAYASGAHGAVLMRNRPDRVLAWMFSEDVAETVSAYAAGRAPSNSRYRHVRLGPRLGFRVDHDDYRQDQLDRDPYYQIPSASRVLLARQCGPDLWPRGVRRAQPQAAR
jgi:hypothetical protein